MKEYVALYQDREYVLGHFTTYGNFSKELGNEFPTILKSKVCKSLLEGIPNLGYLEKEDAYIVWNNAINENLKLTVPVYVKVFDKYKYTGKTYTFEVPSNETLKAAKEIVDIVYQKKQLEMFKPAIMELENLLKEGKGICFVKSIDISHVSWICELTNKEELWSGMHQYVIGDPSMITSLELNLYVPDEVIPSVIGKGGKNIKEMAAKMRVNRIHVLPLEKKSGE